MNFTLNFVINWTYVFTFFLGFGFILSKKKCLTDYISEKIRNLFLAYNPIYQKFIKYYFPLIYKLKIDTHNLSYYIYKLHNDNNHIYHIDTLYQNNYMILKNKKLLYHDDNIDIDEFNYISINLQNRYNNSINYTINIKPIGVNNLLNNRLLNMNCFYKKILLRSTDDSYIYGLIYYYMYQYLKINDIITNITISYDSSEINIIKSDKISDFLNKIAK